MESYITYQQLIEGLIASIVWGAFFIYMRNRLSWPSWIEGGLAWFMVWAFRKFGITIYNSLKKENRILNFEAGRKFQNLRNQPEFFRPSWNSLKVLSFDVIHMLEDLKIDFGEF